MLTKTIITAATTGLLLAGGAMADELGKQEYMNNCANCHGESGLGQEQDQEAREEGRAGARPPVRRPRQEHREEEDRRGVLRREGDIAQQKPVQHKTFLPEDLAQLLANRPA